MRILVDVKLLGRGQTTGISGYTKEVVTALLEHTTDEYRLFYNGFKLNPLAEEWLNNPRISVLNWHIPNKLFHLTTRLFNWPNLNQQKDIDLIFSPHFHLLAKSTLPRVITFHDISFIHYPQFFSLKQRLWHWWQNYAKQADSAASIVSVSDYTKSDLVRFLKIPPEKITTIHSGIGSEFKKLDPHDPRLGEFRKNRSLERPFFLFLGTLEPRKNIPLLIKAFSLVKTDPRFKDYELVIAGRPGFKAHEVYKMAAESPFRSNIRFLDDVADTERVLLYNLARVFVFPSFFEGFGFPPLESQACGTPVVAASRTSLPEILGSSALYTSPWLANELSEQMMQAALTVSVREKLITTGLSNAKKFTWRQAALELSKVFKSAV